MSASVPACCEAVRRPQSFGERIADGAVHVAGVLAGLVGAVAIVTFTAHGSEPARIAAVCVYAGALLAMLSASATYNLGYSSRYRVLFQRCDHAAIFIMIAGTYTPFAISILPALHATALMTFLWLAAIGGIVLRLSSPILFERYAPFVYLILAWSAVPAIGPVIGALHPSALVALVFGGILYSVGVLFFIWERLPFQNAIWHVFVLAAAVCHYIAVLDGIVLMPPGA